MGLDKELGITDTSAHVSSRVGRLAGCQGCLGRAAHACCVLMPNWSWAAMRRMYGTLALHEHTPAWLFNEHSCTFEWHSAAWMIAACTPAPHRRPPPHRGSSWSRPPPLVPLAPWLWALHPCPKPRPLPLPPQLLPARRRWRPASRWRLQSTLLQAAAAGAEGAVDSFEAEVEEAWPACAPPGATIAWLFSVVAVQCACLKCAMEVGFLATIVTGQEGQLA